VVKGYGIKTRKEKCTKKIDLTKRGRFFFQITPIRRERLLAILLNACRAQAGKTVLIDRELPRQKFVDRQRVAAASLFEGEEPATHGGNDFSLAANDPAFGPGRRQIGDR
jgi:hypothetical protein